MSNATGTALSNDHSKTRARRLRRLGVPHTKTLRRYQAQRVRLAIRHIEAGRDVMIEAPTGSGKTLILRSAISLLMDGSITHAIVATPQEATEDGFVTGIATRGLGLAVVALGGGRRTPDDVIDPAVGLSRILPIGAQVRAGDVLALVHAHTEGDAEAAVREVRAAYATGPARPPGDKAVMRRIVPRG